MASNPPLLATLDGYAVEGGFDVPGGIATCYSPAIGLGRLAGPGDGALLWTKYEEAINHVRELGLDGIRVTVEWARVEPRADLIDEAAWERYRNALLHAKDLGLRVTVVMVDAVWPAWLGPEAWVLPWVRGAFAQHLGRLGERLGDCIDGVIAFSQAEALVELGYLRGGVPPWRRRERLDAREARTSIASMEDALQRHPLLGPKLLSGWREVPAHLPSSAWPPVVSDARRASEVHIKSLVRGAGPTASTAGLLEWRNGAVVSSPPTALLELWRA